MSAKSKAIRKDKPQAKLTKSSGGSKAKCATQKKQQYVESEDDKKHRATSPSKQANRPSTAAGSKVKYGKKAEPVQGINST